MTQHTTQVNSIGEFNLNDIVVRMDGGPSSVYKIVEIHDDGVVNIRVNTESGLNCHGSWVHFMYLRKPTASEIKSNWREGDRIWPKITGNTSLCGFTHDELVVLKDPKEPAYIYVILTLIKTGTEPDSLKDKGLAEIQAVYIGTQNSRWVDLKELRHPRSIELQYRTRDTK